MLTFLLSTGAAASHFFCPAIIATLVMAAARRDKISNSSSILGAWLGIFGKAPII